MEAVYEAKTKHTDEMIKQYVKFQNNVNTPTKKLQSVLIAMCVLALMLLVPPKKLPYPVYDGGRPDSPQGNCRGFLYRQLFKAGR